MQLTSVRRCPPRSVMIPHERSGKKSVGLKNPDFVRNSQMNSQCQNCHTEPMKRCELEVRSRPKKAKKYVYHKNCKPVSRKVCDTCEKKTLIPVCDNIQKQVCKYKPQQKCHEEKKEYCFKTEKIIIDEVCVGERREVYDDSFSHV